MRNPIQLFVFTLLSLLMTSCISNKKLAEIQAGHEAELALANKQLGKCGEDLNAYMNKLSACESQRQQLKNDLELRQVQIDGLEDQLQDARTQRDKQLTQVGDLTVLSQAANENIKETLAQIDKKDRYIQYLQAAKTKADSINLALAINLKSVLQEGIDDKDVDIKVDKTVVFINLSDKMLYQSGSSNITPRANEVLGKIAQIIKSKPDLEVMVEGYTDNVPIQNSCTVDNWDLSVKRATSVVRVLQKNYGVDPNKLIAAGRGEYNTLASNDDPEGRSINRRTRIIILPKLNQFYDLLAPTNVEE